MGLTRQPSTIGLSRRRLPILHANNPIRAPSCACTLAFDNPPPPTPCICETPHRTAPLCYLPHCKTSRGAPHRRGVFPRRISATCVSRCCGSVRCWGVRVDAFGISRCDVVGACVVQHGAGIPSTAALREYYCMIKYIAPPPAADSSHI